MKQAIIEILIGIILILLIAVGETIKIAIIEPKMQECVNHTTNIQKRK